MRNLANRGRRFAFSAVVSLLVVLSMAGCGGQSGRVDEGVQLLDTRLALGSTLLMIDTAGATAHLLDLGGDAPRPKTARVPLPERPLSAELRNGDTEEALVLCAGRRGSADADPEPAALVALDAEGNSREYLLGNSPFDALQQSEDGRYAFLFKTGSAARVLDTPNEIALVDLDADPDDDGALTRRILRSFGDTPERVVFSPRMPVLGIERRLAVVLTKSDVTLIDLDNLDRRETTVQLSGSGTAVVPEQVLFDTEAEVIYVRAQASDDVFVLSLQARPGDTEDEGDGTPHNDFRPFINQLGVGQRPTDMAFYGEGDSARVLVVSQVQSQAFVVDAGSSQVTALPLPTDPARALLFEGESPDDDRIAQRALLYREGTRQVVFLDLEGIEERGTQNLELLTLESDIVSLVPMLDEGLALVLHGGSSVSLLDLADRTVSPIVASVELSNAMFDRPRRRLWVGPSGQPWVGLLDLDTGRTDEVLLDSNIDGVVPMFEAGKLAVMHRGSYGHVTVLDAADPVRERAASVRGFFAEGLLDRGQD